MASDDPRFTAQPGPPPVAREAPAQTQTVAEREARAVATYDAVSQAFRSNTRDWRAVRAMLGSDPALMQRFMGTVFSLLAKQSDLLEQATVPSLVQAVKDVAQMGLEPFTGECAIVQYDGIATVLVEYRGYLKMIRASGLVRNIDCQVVYDRDEFVYGWDRQGGYFTHKPFMPDFRVEGAEQDRGGYRYAYAYAIMPDGFCMLEVMTEAEIAEIRDHYSRAGGRRVNAWRDAFGEMARKTVLRRLRKRLPTSPAMGVLTRLEAFEDRAEMPRLEAPSTARRLALSAVTGETPAYDPGASNTATTEVAAAIEKQDA